MDKVAILKLICFSLLLRCINVWAVIPFTGNDMKLAGPIDNFGDVESTSLMLRSGEGSRCSASVIGPRVILTASYCIADNGTESIEIKGESYELKCTRLDLQKGLPSIEIGICYTNRSILGVRPARIDIDRLPTVGDIVALVGYGCTSQNYLGKLGEIYTVGKARVLSNNEKVADGINPFLIVYGASACAGDSGGGVFQQLELTDATVPIIRAVISRADSQKTFAVPLASIEVKAKIKEWSTRFNVNICGLTANQSSCRDELTKVTTETQTPKKNNLPNTAIIKNSENKNGVSIQQPLIQKVRVILPSGESATEAYKRVCGVDLILEKKDIQQDSLLKVQKKAEGQILEIPVCPRPSAKIKSKVKTVLPGDTVWTYYKEEVENKSGKIDVLLKDETTIKPTFEEFKKNIKNLNGLQQIDLIKTNETITIPAAELGIVRKLPNTVSALPPIQPILTLSAASEDCSPPKDSQNYPFNVNLLLDVLRLNRKEQVEPDKTVIAIADSGLEGAGFGIFPEKMLFKQVDWHSYTESISPIVLNKDARLHGTQVASLAVGGVSFSRIQWPFAVSKIQLAIQRIYYTPGDTQDSVLANGDLFNSLLTESEAAGANIINLSLRSTIKIPAIDTDLAYKNSKFLYIAAAGNIGRKIDSNPNVDTDSVYPALYGGQNSSRVITVTALDGKNARAKFANWGNKYVDIGAPGCQVPVLVWDKSIGRFSETHASGTSFSAAEVSFGAGMVFSESGGRLWGAKLKRRMLTSADLDKSLSNDIVDGRILNVVKAASVWNDVLETSDGRILFGDLAFRDNEGRKVEQDFLMTLNCKDSSDFRFKKNALLKIALWNTNGSQFKMKVYTGLESPNDGFESNECNAPTGLTIEMSYGDLKSPEKFKWSDIKDIVFRQN